MTVIDALLGEHGVFYAQFDWIEEALALAPERACVLHLAGMLASALATHAALENELLLDAAGEAAGPSAGPFAVMREEHDEIEARLEAILGSGVGGDPWADLGEVVALARDHFEKEERVAFPMAREVLGVDRLRRAGREWAARRGVALDGDSG